MNPKPLTRDLIEALHAAGDDSLPVIDLTTRKVYFVVDGETHERAMKALRHQENVESIRRGVVNMEAGKGMSLEESRRRTEEAIRQHAK